MASKHVYSGVSETLDEDTLVGRYCGKKLPGPQMSEENSNQMRVRLKTNEAVVKAGFRAKYEFVEKSEDKSTYNITITLIIARRLLYNIAYWLLCLSIPSNVSRRSYVLLLCFPF